MRISTFLSAVSIVTVMASSVEAQAPDSLSHQGLLTDNSGVPVADGSYNMTFSLYDTTSGGSALWTEVHNGGNAVSTVNGIFDVTLGRLVSLSNIVFDKPLYLSLSVNGDTEIRTPLTSSPYALGMRGIHSVWAESGGFKGYTIVAGNPSNSSAPGIVGATIAGGGNLDTFAQNGPNRVGAHFATVGGGDYNTANGDASTIPGGISNTATGFSSLAAGFLSHAKHDGSFVWQDASIQFLSDTLSTTGPNQFFARASGGFRFFTAAANDTTTGVKLTPGSGSWASLSSRAAKSNFTVIDARDYLDKVVSLDLQEWSYNAERDGITHVGPIAEDFYATFGLGPDDRMITNVDADGVALAAIQGLYELVREQQQTLARQQIAIERMTAMLKDAGAE